MHVCAYVCVCVRACVNKCIYVYIYNKKWISPLNQILRYNTDTNVINKNKSKQDQCKVLEMQWDLLMRNVEMYVNFKKA